MVNKNIYLEGCLSVKNLYTHLTKVAKLMIKATEGTYDQRINKWATERFMIEFGEAMIEIDPLINQEAVDVRLNHMEQIVEAKNLYTYLLLCGVLIPPYDWIYEYHYYDKKLNVSYFYNHSAKKYEMAEGERKKVPRKRKDIGTDGNVISYPNVKNLADKELRKTITEKWQKSGLLDDSEGKFKRI